MYNFDLPIDRRNTDSTKWNKYRDQSVLPMWVADMDFPAPEFVLDAVRARLDHGVLGYANTPEGLVDAFVAWIAREFDWAIEREWLVWIPGVVPGLNLASRSIGAPGDGLIINTPVYHPFLAVPRNGGKQPRHSAMAVDGGRWVVDLDDIAAKAPDACGLLLCNPQNPTGRVYSRDELVGIASVCSDHDLVIVSDEIHWSFILDQDKRHIPIASIDPQIAQRTITLIAPTKAYNLAGLNSAVAIIPDADMRRSLVRAKAGLISNISPLAYAAALAAYLDQSA